MILLELQDIADAIENVIEFFETIISFTQNIFHSISLGFQFLLHLVPKGLTAINNLPIWLMPFAVITISISILYFIIGRAGGKSD